MWSEVAGVFLLSTAVVRVARQVALKKTLLDVPNERSSHKVPVPRLGGAAFMPVVLLAIALLAPRTPLPSAVFFALLGGAIALFFVSLVDDLLTLSTSIRFAVQFAAAGVLAWAVFNHGALAGSIAPFSELDLLATRYSLLATVLTIAIVALLNIYNFMDGIDGIAGLQAVVAGISWCMFGTLLATPFVAYVGACIAAGALGFLTLNWPPAKIFMGDAGSTVLGFFLATLPFVAVVETKAAVRLEVLLVAAVLVVWPFLADGTFTILRRLKNRENILKAHRSHLYQRLVIAGKSHQAVTLAYGALAVIGAFLGWTVVRGYAYAIPLSGVVVLAMFGCLWRWTVGCEKREAPRG